MAEQDSSELRVTTTDGAIEFIFTSDDVHVRIVGVTNGQHVIPWPEWEHIARVYGKRGRKS